MQRCIGSSSSLMLTESSSGCFAAGRSCMRWGRSASPCSSPPGCSRACLKAACMPGRPCPSRPGPAQSPQLARQRPLAPQALHVQVQRSYSYHLPICPFTARPRSSRSSRCKRAVALRPLQQYSQSASTACKHVRKPKIIFCWHPFAKDKSVWRQLTASARTQPGL